MPSHKHLKWEYHFEGTFDIHHQAKNNCILPVFLEILQRYCKLVVFGTFGHVWLRTPKVILSSCKTLLSFSAGKKSTSFLMLLWRYCKDMQTYFRYFGHAWLHSPKMIVSTSMFICMQKMNFIIHFFLKILQFKESCNGIGWLYLAHNSRPKILPDMFEKYQ